MSTRRRAVQHDRFQAALPGVDVSAPLRSWQQASGVVGEFFELLTAKMVRGYRCPIDQDAGDNPDVIDGRGRAHESKAAGRGRWLLEAKQAARMAANPDSRYVLWTYTQPGAGGLIAHGTARDLCRWLAANITGCYVMPGNYPQAILAGTAHAEPRESQKAGKFWGRNYWFRVRYLEEVLRNERAITPRFAVHVGGVTLRSIHGIAVPRFRVAWMVNLPPNAITVHDRMLAQVALQELETQRLCVQLVPCDRGDGKKRVVTNENPGWYQAFLDRRRWYGRRGAYTRPKTKPRSPGRRGRVTRALERLAVNEPWQQRNWFGWELLELLRDHEAELGR